MTNTIVAAAHAIEKQTGKPVFGVLSTGHQYVFYYQDEVSGQFLRIDLSDNTDMQYHYNPPFAKR
jgi:hypothetical protein